MGSGAYDMYPHQWREANGYGSPYTRPTVSYGQFGANGCTCGPYASILPPEPCPIHDPERAYWRMKYLREFGNVGVGVTTNTATITSDGIPKYKSPVLEDYPVHFNTSKSLKEADKLACGLDATEDNIRWARVAAWVTCEDCKKSLGVE